MPDSLVCLWNAISTFWQHVRWVQEIINKPSHIESFCQVAITLHGDVVWEMERTCNTGVRSHTRCLSPLPNQWITNSSYIPSYSQWDPYPAGMNLSHAWTGKAKRIRYVSSSSAAWVHRQSPYRNVEGESSLQVHGLNATAAGGSRRDPAQALSGFCAWLNCWRWSWEAIFPLWLYALYEEGLAVSQLCSHPKRLFRLPRWYSDKFATLKGRSSVLLSCKILSQVCS